jgi:hypothetical protein
MTKASRARGAEESAPECFYTKNREIAILLLCCAAAAPLACVPLLLLHRPSGKVNPRALVVDHVEITRLDRRTD